MYLHTKQPHSQRAAQTCCRLALHTFIPVALSEESLVPYVSSVVVWLLNVYLTERGKPLARVSCVHCPLELAVQW